MGLEIIGFVTHRVSNVPSVQYEMLSHSLLFLNGLFKSELSDNIGLIEWFVNIARFPFQQ